MAEPYTNATHRPDRRPWQGIRARLIGVLLIPTLAAMVFGGLSISRALVNSRDAQQAESVAQALPDSYNLAIQLMFERDTDTTQVPEVVVTSLHRQTDQAIKAWSAKAADIDYGDDKELASTVSEARQDLSRIAEMRAKLANKDTMGSTQVHYTDIMNLLFGISGHMPALSDDEVYNQIRALSNIRAASEAFGQERRIMMTALTLNKITNEQYTNLAQAKVKWDLATEDFYAKTSAETRNAMDALSNHTTSQGSTGVPSIGAVNRVVMTGRISKAGMGPEEFQKSSTVYIAGADSNGGLKKMIVDAATGVSQDVTQIRKDAVTSAIVTAAVVLFVLLLALTAGLFAARSILNPLSRLRRLAYNVANHDLPERVAMMHDAEGPVDLRVDPLDIPRRDEIGEVADAFDAVHAEAIRLAGEQAELRSNVDKMFVNLSRRSQSLVERQLQLIDQLEANEQDPDDLANLFRLDHLATRMRRNDESLLVLAGGEIGHAARGPVPVLDVLRAAASEIEQFARVDIDSDENAEFEGAIAGDLVHLLAEMIENATNFSPPDTAVTLRTFRAGPSAPLLVEIEDLGIGMTPEELQAANLKLRRSSGLDADVARMMGLVVTARLAARHGLFIELVANRPRGVVARVEIPVTAIVGAHAALPAGASAQNGAYQGAGDMAYEMQYGMPAYDASGYGAESPYATASPYATGNPYDMPVGALPAPDAPMLPSRTPGASNHGGGHDEQPAFPQNGQPVGFQGSNGFGAVPPMPGDPGFEQGNNGFEQGNNGFGLDSGYGDAPANGSSYGPGQDNGFGYAQQVPAARAGDPYGSDPYNAEPFGADPYSSDPNAADFAGGGQNGFSNGLGNNGFANEGNGGFGNGADNGAGAGAGNGPSMLSNMLPIRNAEALRERFPDGHVPTGGDDDLPPRRDQSEPSWPAPDNGVGGPGQATSNFRSFSQAFGDTDRERPTPPPGFGFDDDPFGPGQDAAAAGLVAPDPLGGPNPLDSTTEVRLDDEDVSPIFADLQSEWFTRRRPLGARRHLDGGAAAPEAPRGPTTPPPAGRPEQAGGLADLPSRGGKPDPLSADTPVPTDPDEPSDVSWSSPGDEGWRRAAELEQQQTKDPDTITQGGLPVRVPGQNLIPGAAPAVTPPSPGPRNMDARKTRGLSSFQKGVSRARNNDDPADNDDAGSIPEGEEQQ